MYRRFFIYYLVKIINVHNTIPRNKYIDTTAFFRKLKIIIINNLNSIRVER